MTETVTKPYRVASGEGIANVWWKSGRVTVKAGGAETDHTFSQIETDDPRGSGPPLHLHHNEDETFYVLEGQVTMFVGDERIDLDAGDYIFGARGVPHAYLIRSEVERVRDLVRSGGMTRLAERAHRADQARIARPRDPNEETVGAVNGRGPERLPLHG